MTIGEKIVFYRNNARFSQEELAYKSTLDGDYVSYDEDVLSLYIETEFVLAMMKPEDSRYTYYSGIAEVEVLDDIVCM